MRLSCQSVEALLHTLHTCYIRDYNIRTSLFRRNCNVGHLRNLIVVVPNELFVCVPSELFGHS